MKQTILLLALSSASAFAGISTGSTFTESAKYVNFVRQTQLGTDVSWDMPVVPVGTGPSALGLDNGGSLFQLWTIQQSPAKEFLLDQKLVSAYLPSAAIKVTTLDPEGKVPRTRVDQPFTVEINVSGLLTGVGLPAAASQVLLEQHIASYPKDQFALDPVSVMSNTPLHNGYISVNGNSVLKFPASSLTAADPTKVSGEEHFVVHALADDSSGQTQIASGHVQVWPVASGAIEGIKNGDLLRFDTPRIELTLNDLYPRSDTAFMLYEGSSVNGSQGTVVKAFPWTSDTITSTTISVTELGSKFTANGTYTVALVSKTVYGTELLCPPVTFDVDRTIRVNAMQVTYSNESGE